MPRSGEPEPYALILRRYRTFLALLLCTVAAAAQPATETPPQLLDAFAFRHIGPIGNRVSAVAGVSGDPRTWYAGAASGGLWRSNDGGVGWEPIFDRQEAASIGSIAIAPSDPNVVWVGTGESFIRSNISIAQMYHVSTDDRRPYFVYGNRQDGPSMRGPSRILYGGRTQGIPVGEWHSVGGCEVGFSMVHRADPDLVWTGCYDGQLELYDLRSGQSRDVSVWPLAIESSPASDLEYRFQWTAPFATSPHDPELVYAGSQYVHRSRDRGQSWERISPDLTTADPALMRRSGGLTLDDAGPTIAPVVFAIAESPLEPGLIWAGTNDGQVQLTRDGGESWINVTANLPGLPPLGTVRNIDPSDVDAGAAYVAVDRHQEGDTTPYVFRTNDYGETWTDLAAVLPRGPLANVHAVREDPEQPELLFLGTENGLWVSFDDLPPRRACVRSWIPCAGRAGSTPDSLTWRARSARPTPGRRIIGPPSGGCSATNSPRRKTVSTLLLSARWPT